MTALWERQEKERSKPFAAFQAYRDLGPQRTFGKVAELLGKSDTLMDRWAAQYKWRMRAQAWDDELDRRKREAAAKEVEDMGRRQAQQAQAIEQALLVPVLALLERMKRTPEIVRELPACAIEDLIMLSAKVAGVWPNVMRVERLARGEPTEALGTVRLANADGSKLWDGVSERELAERMLAILAVEGRTGGNGSVP